MSRSWLSALALAGCINPTTIVPSQSRTPAAGAQIAAPPSEAARHEGLRSTVARYNEHPGNSRTFDKLAVFPESGYLRTLGSGMVTMGFFAIDLGQSVLDQEDKPWLEARWRRVPAFSPATCRAAESSNADEILAFGVDDIGNPP